MEIPRPNDSAAAARDFAFVHHRFARVAVWIYSTAAALTVTLLIVALVTDLSHEKNAVRNMLLRETELRAQYFAWYLGLLENELHRLGLRSEVDLLDEDMGPERSLLELAHNKSTFFNVGVAIIGADGTVAWSEPRSFLTPGRSVGGESWFRSIRNSATVRIEPVQPERESDALIYVVSPVVRGGQFAGVLLGAIDLAGEAALTTSARPDVHVDTVLAARDGSVVYPPKPPAFAAEAGWRALLTAGTGSSFLADGLLGGRRVVAGVSAVSGANFLLLSLVDEERLFAPARARLFERLSVGLVVTVIPLFVLVQALRRSLESFRKSEEEMRREERLRLLGEAVNAIAHEITNALNGLRVGLDLIGSGDGGSAGRNRTITLGALRSEVQRLTEFTTELLIFSKGLSPRPVTVEMGEFVRKVVELTGERAEDQGVVLEVEANDGPVSVYADPKLLHVVLVNLLGNALDAVASAQDPSPRVVVKIKEGPRIAEVRVSDNGPGITEPLRPRLFEPFVSGKPNGIGIGLSLSRKIARAHGGELELESAGPGATFLLTLPKGDS